MKKLKKIVYGLLLGIGSLVLMLVIASVIIILLEIRVELNTIRKPVEVALEKALDRKVRFSGDISLIPTLWPTLEVQDVQIDNPRNWKQGVFAEAELVRIQLGLLPLLKKKIHLGEVTVKGITVNLQNNLQGTPNWLFDISEDPLEHTQEVVSDDGVAITYEAINTLVFEDISIHYQDLKLNRRFRFNLATVEGSGAQPEEPFDLYIEGDFEDKRYQLEITGGSIQDLRDKTKNWPIQIMADIAGTPVSIKGTLEREAEPEVHAELTMGHVDIGATLAWMKIATDINASSDSMSITTELRGKSLSELLALSRFRLTIDHTLWTLTDPNTNAQLPITVNKGQLVINPGRPVLLSLDSQIGPDPVLIQIKGSKLSDYGRENKKHPLKIKVQGNATALTLESGFFLPIGTKKTLDFTMQLQGDRLDRLDQLLKIDLPPVGPYSLAGGFSVNPQGYAIKDLLLQVGGSDLRGDLSFITTETPPRLNVQLESNRLQINDFNLEGWSARGEESDLPEDKTDPVEYGKKDGENVRKLLSPEVFGSLNAKVDIQVREVLSGADVLGRGSLLLSLEQGRFNLNPLQVKVPGGEAELQIELFPTKRYVEVGLLAKLDRFDYGILARRIDEKSEAAGKLSLDVDLTAKVEDKRYLLANGTGHFDFGVWPDNMNAEVFDLWAVNLLNAVVSETDKEEQSRVNCAVAGFRLNDGIMKQNVLFVDTSRMQIQGTADVNFKKKKIELYVEPKAKRPEFFSLATPVRITGKFEDFGIGVNPLHVAGSAIRFVTSPVVVPFHRLFTRDAPTDGATACRSAWDTRNNAAKK